MSDYNDNEGFSLDPGANRVANAIWASLVVAALYPAVTKLMGPPIKFGKEVPAEVSPESNSVPNDKQLLDKLNIKQNATGRTPE